MMKKLNMMCPIGQTGYGITSYNIYKSLRDKKLDITLFPIGSIQLDDPSYQEQIIFDINKNVSFCKDTPCFKIWHQFDLATRIGNGKYCALTFFETDKLKPIEINMINNLDYVFVASEWAKSVLLNNNITIPIYISRLGVDPKIFNNDVNETVKKDMDKYVFLNIGKWEIRKGHDILIELFNQAFTENDNVELWMVNHNPFLSERETRVWTDLYSKSKLSNKIKLLPRVPTHQKLAQLIALSDCGIFPARAEGWNNEIPEMFAINKPVILTNYSAHTEYANEDNAYLIDIDSLVPALDDKFFDGYGNWADFSTNQYEQCISHMRYVYNNNIRTNPAGLEMAKSLTWDNTANTIYNIIYGE
jgi:glycosyltransferase involved in cell wall biosynthesis